MRYSPTLCQGSKCTELLVSNSCNSCCDDLPKDAKEITITVTYENISNSETIAISSQEDLDGVLATFTLEEFIYLTVCYDTTLVPSNITYSVIINGIYTFSYTNVGGTWDDILTGLYTDINAHILFTAILEDECIKISGSGVTSISTITATSTLESAGPYNLTGEPFPNGVYEIKSFVTFTDDTTDTIITYLPFVCQLESCIFTELARVYDLLACDCNKDCIEAITTAYTILVNIQSFPINNQIDIDNITKQIEYLESFCVNKDCNCG